jgi:hypothetical protein
VEIRLAYMNCISSTHSIHPTHFAPFLLDSRLFAQSGQYCITAGHDRKLNLYKHSTAKLITTHVDHSRDVLDLCMCFFHLHIQSYIFIYLSSTHLLWRCMTELQTTRACFPWVAIEPRYSGTSLKHVLFATWDLVPKHQCMCL